MISVAIISLILIIVIIILFACVSQRSRTQEQVFLLYWDKVLDVKSACSILGVDEVTFRDDFKRWMEGI